MARRMRGFRPKKLSRGFFKVSYGRPARADGTAAMSPDQSEGVFDAPRVWRELFAISLTCSDVKNHQLISDIVRSRMRLITESLIRKLIDENALI